MKKNNLTLFVEKCMSNNTSKQENYILCIANFKENKQDGNQTNTIQTNDTKVVHENNTSSIHTKQSHSRLFVFRELDLFSTHSFTKSTLMTYRWSRL